MKYNNKLQKYSIHLSYRNDISISLSLSLIGASVLLTYSSALLLFIIHVFCSRCDLVSQKHITQKRTSLQIVRLEKSSSEMCPRRHTHTHTRVMTSQSMQMFGDAWMQSLRSSVLTDAWPQPSHTFTLTEIFIKRATGIAHYCPKNKLSRGNTRICEDYCENWDYSLIQIQARCGYRGKVQFDHFV